MGRWSRRLAPLFTEFAAVRGAARVVDVGCGTGSLAFSLAQHPQLVAVRGVDLSHAYIAHAKRHNSDPRLSFETGDACALELRDASVDYALCMLVLQFVPRPELAVREMRRITRRGGTVAAATWDSRGGLVAQRIVLDTAAALDASGEAFRARTCTRPMSSRDNLVRAWREAGLLDIEVTMLTIRMDFDSFTDFWAPAEGRDGPVAEYVATLSPELRSQLRAAVRRAYVDGDQDGERSYAATAWAVKGKVP